MAKNASPAEYTPQSRAGLASWCFFDWANSAFTTVIVTFIFAAYFSQAVAANPVEGTVLWSRALTIAGLIVAIASPLLGAIADSAGSRKPWVFGFTTVCVIMTAGLWFAEPSPDFVILALGFYIVATIAYEFSLVFYDAMLPHIAPQNMLGRISGWGWATGYAGGLLCMIISLWLVTGGGAEVLGLDTEKAEHVRATTLLVALWFALFAMPLFLFTTDRPSTGISVGAAMRTGLRQLPAIWPLLKQHPSIARFLLANMFYNDGLVTLFAFGGIYAAGEFGMETADILMFGIALNISAGIGAFGFAWVDDAIGSKKTIMLTLTGLIVTSTALVLTDSLAVFWVMAVILGIFVGPTQAAGRSMMARLSPKGMETEMFGLYALSGKATAFAGPLALGLAVQFTGSQRMGVATVVALFLMGLFVLMTVREPQHRLQAGDVKGADGPA